MQSVSVNQLIEFMIIVYVVFAGFFLGAFYKKEDKIEARHDKENLN